MELSCPTGSLPALRSSPNLANDILARCAPRLIALSQTVKSLAISPAKCSGISSGMASLDRRCYDVSHNTCKVEQPRRRQWAPARAVRPPEGARRGRSAQAMRACLDALRPVGQPVLIGGSMGAGLARSSAGTAHERAERAFSSACHGAGRAAVPPCRPDAHMERAPGGRRRCEAQGIIVRSPSPRGVAEEGAGQADKDVAPWSMAAAEDALALARRVVADLRPLICIKG